VLVCGIKCRINHLTGDTLVYIASSIDKSRVLAMALTSFGSDITQAMWVPANKDALPSMEEMQCARGAIKELEIILQDAVELLERAKARVVALTKDLEERHAWIAPVRKLPVEILSEIFIFTSEVDDLSPVTITGVCSLWREVIISTPRAWSLIYADRLYSLDWGAHVYPGLLSQYFSTFIERSNPCLLHISMPENQFDEESDIYRPHSAEEVVLSAVHRIQCLSITSRQLNHFAPEVFPNLTRLTLSNGIYEIQVSFFSRSRFPCLRYLNCGGCGMENSPQPGTTLFPPLQYLVLDTEEDEWIELVQGCADSLVGLELFGGVDFPMATISFPKLNSLAFSSLYGVAMPIEAKTPALQSYVQLSNSVPGMQHRVFHDDIKKVTHLRIDCLLDLADFVTLRVLQYQLVRLESPSEVIHIILDRLQESKETCPALQAIQFYISERDYRDADFKTMIPSFHNSAQRARPHITLSFTNQLLEPLPGSVLEVQVGIVRSRGL
jgi:F-box-like